MVAGHQPAVVPLDLGLRRVRRHAEGRVGVFERHPDVPNRARVNARGDQALELEVVGAGKAEPGGDVEEDAGFLGVYRAVRPGGLDLDLQEHAHEIDGAPALAAELREHRVEREVRLPARVEQGPRRFPLGRIEPELVHHLVGQADFLRADAAVRLGDMAHDPEHRSEERKLNALHALAGRVGDLDVPQRAADEPARRRTEQRPDGAAEQKSERAAEQQSPPAHGCAPRRQRDAEATGIAPSMPRSPPSSPAATARSRAGSAAP